MSAKVECRELLAEADANLRTWQSVGNLPRWAADSIEWLMANGHFAEINDRFFQNLQFGTGGMRGRCIGSVVTPAEGDAISKKFHRSAIGSATMNDINIARAAIALHRHCKKWLESNGDGSVLRLIVAHDVRHFSKIFGKIVCSIWNILGGEAFVFDEARSTPELSFALRRLGATAGVVITASHNPFHDNGFKAYFSDGAQMIDPHAASTMDLYAKVSIAEACELLSRVEGAAKTFLMPCQPIDDAYVKFLGNGIVDGKSLGHIKKPIVYTSLHGVGIVATKQLADAINLPIVYVEEQCRQDPNFSTAPSPNPENPATFALAIAKCDAVNSDLAIAADPDGDRMAIACRGRNGKMRTLSGNETAIFLGERRLRALFATGKLSAATAANGVIVRSLVTTPLLDAIGESYGVKTIRTPVGFKWIGAKLKTWEDAAVKACLAATGKSISYRDLGEDARREFLLNYSNYLILGAEESCGYMALDGTRDKDSHSALLMACEAYGAIVGEGRTMDDFFDGIYERFGYHGSKLHTVTFSGASGVRRINALMDSFEKNPCKAFCSKKVISWKNLESEGAEDGIGGKFFSKNFFMAELDGGFTVAIRGSGTEAKVKFYFFYRDSGGDVRAARCFADEEFSKMAIFAEADANSRA
ncbi:MAG: phospho-sugar mutase [Puniceicoccales bacterium]|jgi:phosphoglucomutase|nr:phospho-sugar mutase [Puniceicoccales bacterium]